jgi:transcriptional regulator with XRE-family HTH domain
MAFQASWLQKQLGSELLALRESHKMTTRTVGEALGWAASKVARMERAENQIDPQDIIKLGRLYGITDAEAVRLCEMARSSRTDIWWERYKPWLADSYYTAIGYENDATRIRMMHPALIPGLLQTRAYIAAMYTNSAVVADPDRAEVLTEVRLLRQRRLTEPEPLALDVVIPESVLLAEFGTDEVMHDQFKHLLEVMDLPNVDIRVMALSSAADRVMVNLIEFGSDDGPAIVSCDTLFGTVFYDAPVEIAQTRRIVNQLRELAMSPSESRRFIEQMTRKTT